MHGITIQVVDRGEPVSGAQVVVGASNVKTDAQGRAECTTPDDVQLVQVKHDGFEVRRWVLSEAEESVVIDLSVRAPAESLVESLVGDRYRFLEVLGRGGMGVVIKAHDALLNRVVAIKMLAGELENNEEAQRIFLEEARSLAPLSHPNLVAIHDIQHLQGHTLMVLEFVIGENLDRRMQNGRLRPDAVLRYVIQMARATSFMHSKGFIHRDLKPGNVIVGDDDQVKIIDFGLARSLDQISVKGTQIRGTPAYMAPEQIRGLDLTQKVDTYQLGVTMYELLTGQLPFSGDMGYAHVHSDPPSLLAVLPDINPEIADLVSACMAKDPEARPTARDLLDELQSLYVITADEISDAIHDIERLSGERISDWKRTTGSRLAAIEGPSEVVEERSTTYLVPFVILVMLLFGGLAAYLVVRSPAEILVDAPPTAQLSPSEPVATVTPPPEPAEVVTEVTEPDLGTPGTNTVADTEIEEVPPPVEKPAEKPVAQPAPRPKPVVHTAPVAPPPVQAPPVEKPKPKGPAIRTSRRTGSEKTEEAPKQPAESEIRLSR